MDELEELEDCLLEMEQCPLVAGSFTWAGKDYVCLASSRDRSKNFELGGAVFEDDLRIFVRVGLFDGARPDHRQTLVCDGTTYRIDKISQAQGDVFLKLMCNDASSAA